MHIYSELLTDREVAALLACSKATVWRRSAKKQIPAPLRIAGSTRWRSHDIDRFINEKAIEAGLEPATTTSSRT
jgi:predicted DNA-binding transcriptional regulator AlpA